MNQSDITVFTQHGQFGLRLNGKVLLAPEYDAVWALGHGFHGFRQGHRYGILAPDGRGVLPACVLPACFAGYRMLDLGQQLAYAALGPEQGLRDLLRDFPGLRLQQRVPCHPIDWWAEQALADLWEEDEDNLEILTLPAGRKELVLRSDGTWSWEPRDPEAARLVLCGTGQPGEFDWLDHQLELLPPNTEQLLWWQTRCQRVLELFQRGDEAPLPDQAEALLEQQEADRYERTLDGVLKQAGLQGLFMVGDLDFADFEPYEEEMLDPQVRTACYEHLGRYVELDEAGREAAAELLQLAWLWANGYVDVDYATGRALVDERYDCTGDFDPVLQEETTPLNLYNFYCLDRLEPLLRG